MKSYRESAFTLYRVIVMIQLTIYAQCGCREQSLESTLPIKDLSKDVRLVYELPATIAGEANSASHAFEIRNDTQEQIRFTGTKKSCSCTNASLDQMELPSGCKTRLTLNANISGFTGMFGTECHLENELGCSWVCGLKTMIYPQLSISPELLQLGVVDPGQKVEREFRVLAYNRSPAPPSITFQADKRMVKSHFADQLVSTDTLAGGIYRHEFIATASITLDGITGVRNCSIETKVNDVLVEGAPFRVCWLTEEKYERIPDGIFFRVVDTASDLLNLRMKLRRRDNSKFSIASISDDCDSVDVSCSTSDSLQSSHELLFALKTEELKTLIAGEAVVKIDLPSHDTLTIPIAASR